MARGGHHRHFKRETLGRIAEICSEFLKHLFFKHQKSGIYFQGSLRFCQKIVLKNNHDCFIVKSECMVTLTALKY